MILSSSILHEAPLARLWQKCAPMDADSVREPDDEGRAEFDPLQDFLAEPPTQPPPQLAESKQDDHPAGGGPAVSAPPDVAVRVSGAEQVLERVVVDVSNLRSDVATLVSAIDDIKKRQIRRPGERLGAVPVPAPRRPRNQGAAAAGAAVMVMTIIAWAVVSMGSYRLPEPESQPPGAELVEPVAETPLSGEGAGVTPGVHLQNAAAVTGVAVPAVAPPPPAAPPPRAEPRAEPRPEPRARVTYVGTLTIDASPAGEVFVNRKSVGRTPVRVEKLRAGSHLIWIQRDGYRRWTRVVPVAANRISRVSADLDPIDR